MKRNRCSLRRFYKRRELVRTCIVEMVVVYIEPNGMLVEPRYIKFKHDPWYVVTDYEVRQLLPKVANDGLQALVTVRPWQLDNITGRYVYHEGSWFTVIDNRERPVDR